MSQFFASGGQSIRVSASASLLPMNTQGLISFKMDWLDLFAVRGIFKSLLQHHSSKVSILWCSALFIVQLSHSYMTTGKTIALTRRTLVGKVMSLLLDTLSRLIITFLPKSKGKYFIFSGFVLPGYRKPEQKVWSLNTVSSGWCCDSLIEMKSCPPYPIG